MAAVLGRVAAALGLAAVLAVPCASAQFGADPVTEEEATVFLGIFTGELRNCEQDAVMAHFLPGVNVYVVHADGRQEILSPSDRAYINGYCNPYRINPFKITKPDWANTQFTQDGAAMIVTWELALGGQGWGKRGSPKVVFNDWVKLIKDNHEIRVTGAGWQARDLVPGGEEEYYTRLREGAPSYYLKKFYHTLMHGLPDPYGRMKQRIRAWSQKRREAESTQ